MASSQLIITRKHPHAFFLVLTLADDADIEQVREVVAGFSGTVRSVSSRAPEANLVGILGIGSGAWDRLFRGPRPALLHPFIELDGPHTAPSTPGDLLIHLKSDSAGLCYEAATKVVDDFGANATVVDEVHGFRYFDLRDLIGFVDGTENPVGQAAIDAITVADDDPSLQGGSYVAVQRYVHDLPEWTSLTTEEQEAAIGRTKADNIEMDDETKPSNSHIALNVITDDDGDELSILRDNMPYGRADGERGTFFIAYSASPRTTERMLANMFLGDPPGNTDRLLDFTTAVTGSQYFAPPGDFLDDPPLAPGTAGAAAPEPPTTTDGSLHIGSLR
ncbi:Dyp-type peroxidase [Gordonia defluvii]|jgi:putative iron-dependent peroxidase|uniref:Dyp-type peroxidase n=1 Tax=Gordonia defluvii TaxID=283718 RepID=A0ABP6L0N4_9ACTN|nr:Dyp-type peroxidase [Gordonia sp. UBA5067]